MTVVASAPGRVNLIGEHTDYNGGFVLPVALPLRVTVELEPNADDRIRVTSTAFDGDQWHEVGLARTEPTGTWVDHVLGPARILMLEGILSDPELDGFDARITSDLPLGAGLGSSAAIEVAVMRAILGSFGRTVDAITLAMLAQRSENEFVGARSGIMDQIAASIGTERDALFLDCRSLEHRRIRLPGEMELVVVHSGVTHQHSSGEYNVRRRQCEEAARALGVAQLRDLGPADTARIDALPEPLSRRARHVVAENARVLGAVAALRESDLAALGELIDGSHRSLRDDYEVSTPEVDLLVELVREQEGVHGARITGGGFGGSIVAVADAGAGHRAAALAVAEYEQRTGRDARILLPALAL